MDRSDFCSAILYLMKADQFSITPVVLQSSFPEFKFSIYRTFTPSFFPTFPLPDYI